MILLTPVYMYLCDQIEMSDRTGLFGQPISMYREDFGTKWMKCD